MDYYAQELETVYRELDAGAGGLTEEEAEKRLLEQGKNKLEEGKKTTLFQRFFKQFADPMILVLIAAAVVSGITAVYEGESMVDSFIILFVVIINAVLGVVQESKAEKAIDALKKMTAATNRAVRSGYVVRVKSEDLVRGDVIELEAGDAVPADCRIMECASMKVEEAALTGESVPVDKTSDVLPGDKVPLGDRKNMLYMGSTVVYGRGKAMVCGTGMRTEMGKIADAITQAKEELTPLQKNLSKLSKILTYIVLGICVFIFILSLVKTGDFSGAAMLDTFMIAVSLAVAAIPEGLAAVVTIVLSMGITKMAKRNAVIRRMTAVETLGCTQVICSDKTGTLTQNKMTVVKQEAADERLLAKAMALCSDAELDASGEAVGEPTECALVNYAASLGLRKNELAAQAPRVGEAPFDSMRKMMSTVHKENGGWMQYTKGAPDEILRRCVSCLDGEGNVVPLTEALRQEILEINKEYADSALRVLGAAFRKHEQEPSSYQPQVLERELVFIGLTGMIDPIRPEVKVAMEECRGAGIRPIMITGDHIDTAVAIAKELGIITSAEQAVTGAHLDELSEEELFRQVENYSVYARVQPEHKVRLVRAWKQKGCITAMTGDGVNDAPAIKNSDIGVGMGITGTDVTKNVADMVLTDDNFATIVTAVGEGRRIYDNIRKAIQFLLSSNLSEVVSIFVATLLGFVILSPVHILWINLITDTFPALALGMEKEEPGLMRRSPRSVKEGIFSGGLAVDVIWQGLMVAGLTLLAYFIGHYMESGVWEIAKSPDGMTMAFLTMSVSEVFHAYNLRSRRQSSILMKTPNWYLLGAMAASLILTTAILYIPFFREIFAFEHISLQEYGVALILAFTVIPIVELVKGIRYLITRKDF